MPRNTFQDLTLLRASVATPAASATATSAGIDLTGWTSAAWPDLLAVVDVPALTTAQLPNGSTITFSLLASNQQTLAAPISVAAIGTISGAGGVGSAAATFATRLPSTGGRYFGLQVQTSASVAATAVTQTLLFAVSN